MTNLTFGDLFVEHKENDYKSGRKKTKLTVDLSDIGVQWLRQNDDFVKSMSLSFLPMVVPPMDWTIPEGTGGYYDPAINSTYTLVKGRTRQQIAKLSERFPGCFDKVMETINVLQRTPFRINQTVYEAVQWVHANEINLDRSGIPTYTGGWETMLGAEKAQEYFMLKRFLVRSEGRYTEQSREDLLNFIRSFVEGSAEMEEKELWKEWANVRNAVVKHSRGESSKKVLMDNTITDASWFEGEDIYFSYNVDYRGRVYPLAGQFSPQGSDISRGVIEFGAGVDVNVFEDDNAVRQIAIVCANNFGEDKISLDDREAWAEDHSFEMMECARDFKNNQWWMQADKPFLFLQACLEWTKVMDARLGDGQMVSTMPIAFDGSCNGLQHFSAMFKDTSGAEAVNLTQGDVPSDVYQIVANRALEVAKEGKDKLSKFIVEICNKTDGDLFGRKVTKRSVMTLPYGVSQRSSTAYVVDTVDSVLRKHPTGITGTQQKLLRSKMGKLVWSAITDVVSTPVIGKDYFQAVAKELAKWDKDLLWFTPTGFPVVQSLKKRDVKSQVLRVTVNGKEVQRQFPKYTKNIDGAEQANAVSPNFVHSFDSSHLQSSITEASYEGMTNFLVIHDSFSTDCQSAGRFNHIIREQFVEMYDTHDHLNKFHDLCQERLGFPMMTTRMQQGDFDVTNVLESDYFFA